MPCPRPRAPHGALAGSRQRERIPPSRSTRAPVGSRTSHRHNSNLPTSAIVCDSASRRRGRRFGERSHETLASLGQDYIRRIERRWRELSTLLGNFSEGLARAGPRTRTGQVALANCSVGLYCYPHAGLQHLVNAKPSSGNRLILGPPLQAGPAAEARVQDGARYLARALCRCCDARRGERLDE